MKNTQNFKSLMTHLHFSDDHKANGYRAKYTIVGKIYTLWSLSITEHRRGVTPCFVSLKSL